MQPTATVRAAPGLATTLDASEEDFEVCEASVVGMGEGVADESGVLVVLEEEEEEEEEEVVVVVVFVEIEMEVDVFVVGDEGDVCPEKWVVILVFELRLELV